MSEIGTIANIDDNYVEAVFGSMDKYAKKIEKTLHVSIVYRDGQVRVIGGGVNVKRAISVLETLETLAKKGNDITEQNVDYALSLTFSDKTETMVELDGDIICRTINGKHIK